MDETIKFRTKDGTDTVKRTKDGAIWKHPDMGYTDARPGGGWYINGQLAPDVASKEGEQPKAQPKQDSLLPAGGWRGMAATAIDKVIPFGQLIAPAYRKMGIPTPGEFLTNPATIPQMAYGMAKAPIAIAQDAIAMTGNDQALQDNVRYMNKLKDLAGSFGTSNAAQFVGGMGWSPLMPSGPASKVGVSLASLPGAAAAAGRAGVSGLSGAFGHALEPATDPNITAKQRVAQITDPSALGALLGVLTAGASEGVGEVSRWWQGKRTNMGAAARDAATETATGQVADLAQYAKPNRSGEVVGTGRQATRFAQQRAERGLMEDAAKTLDQTVAPMEDTVKATRNGIFNASNRGTQPLDPDQVAGAGLKQTWKQHIDTLGARIGDAVTHMMEYNVRVPVKGVVDDLDALATKYAQSGYLGAQAQVGRVKGMVNALLEKSPERQALRAAEDAFEKVQGALPDSYPEVQALKQANREYRAAQKVVQDNIKAMEPVPLLDGGDLQTQIAASGSEGKNASMYLKEAQDAMLAAEAKRDAAALAVTGLQDQKFNAAHADLQSARKIAENPTVSALEMRRTATDAGKAGDYHKNPFQRNEQTALAAETADAFQGRLVSALEQDGKTNKVSRFWHKELSEANKGYAFAKSVTENDEAIKALLNAEPSQAYGLWSKLPKEKQLAVLQGQKPWVLRAFSTDNMRDAVSKVMAGGASEGTYGQALAKLRAEDGAAATIRKLVQQNPKSGALQKIAQDRATMESVLETLARSEGGVDKFGVVHASSISSAAKSMIYKRFMDGEFGDSVIRFWAAASKVKNPKLQEQMAQHFLNTPAGRKMANMAAMQVGSDKAQVQE